MAQLMLGFQRCVFERDSASLDFASGLRVVFVRSGEITLEIDGSRQTLHAERAVISSKQICLSGVDGEVWVWALSAQDARCPIETGALARRAFYPLLTDAHTRYALRCDRVSFPPDGIAYTHVHAAAGVRCVDFGSIFIDSLGHRWTAMPHDTWLERGPEPVFAQATSGGPASFVRVMLVPETHWGRSTITYVLPEDQEKPKVQQYIRYLEEPVDLHGFERPASV